MANKRVALSDSQAAGNNTNLQTSANNLARRLASFSRHVGIPTKAIERAHSLQSHALKKSAFAKPKLDSVSQKKRVRDQEGHGSGRVKKARKTNPAVSTAEDDIRPGMIWLEMLKDVVEKKLPQPPNELSKYLFGCYVRPQALGCDSITLEKLVQEADKGQVWFPDHLVYPLGAIEPKKWMTPKDLLYTMHLAGSRCYNDLLVYGQQKDLHDNFYLFHKMSMMHKTAGTPLPPSTSQFYEYHEVEPGDYYHPSHSRRVIMMTDWYQSKQHLCFKCRDWVDSTAYDAHMIELHGQSNVTFQRLGFPLIIAPIPGPDDGTKLTENYIGFCDICKAWVECIVVGEIDGILHDASMAKWFRHVLGHHKEMQGTRDQLKLRVMCEAQIQRSETIRLIYDITNASDPESLLCNYGLDVDGGWDAMCRHAATREPFIKQMTAKIASLQQEVDAKVEQMRSIQK